MSTFYEITQSIKEQLKTADPFENSDVFESIKKLEIQKMRVNKILGITITN